MFIYFVSLRIYTSLPLHVSAITETSSWRLVFCLNILAVLSHRISAVNIRATSGIVSELFARSADVHCICCICGPHGQCQRRSCYHKADVGTSSIARERGRWLPLTHTTRYVEGDSISVPVPLNSSTSLDQLSNLCLSTLYLVFSH